MTKNLGENLPRADRRSGTRPVLVPPSAQIDAHPRTHPMTRRPPGHPGGCSRTLGRAARARPVPRPSARFVLPADPDRRDHPPPATPPPRRLPACAPRPRGGRAPRTHRLRPPPPDRADIAVPVQLLALVALLTLRSSRMSMHGPRGDVVLAASRPEHDTTPPTPHFRPSLRRKRQRSRRKRQRSATWRLPPCTRRGSPPGHCPD